MRSVISAYSSVIQMHEVIGDKLIKRWRRNYFPLTVIPHFLASPARHQLKMSEVQNNACCFCP